MDLDLLRDPVLGGLDQGQESEGGTGLFRVALPKPRMGILSSTPTGKRLRPVEDHLSIDAPCTK
jgi:hypothetical protein